MRKATEIPTTDVSKALFMDLAFLLIAALVLLIQEPTKQSQQLPDQRSSKQASFDGIPTSRIRSVAVTGVIEKEDILGESLLLQIDVDGSVKELPVNGEAISRPIGQLADRIKQMKGEGDRVIVLAPDYATPYAKVAEIRDVLSLLRDEGGITHIYEVVRKAE